MLNKERVRTLGREGNCEKGAVIVLESFIEGQCF